MFDNLPADLVKRNLALQKAFVNETSDLDTTYGPFHDSILYYSALFAAANQKRLEDIECGFKLKALLEDPDAAPTGVVDDVASNWLVTRKNGAHAHGLVTVILPKAVTTIIPSKTTFTANNQSFVTTGSHILRADGGSIVAHGDCILYETKHGWAADIPVIATHSGTSGNIRQSTPFAINRNLTAVKSAFAKSDFTGGSNAETNKQLLKRLTSTTAARIISNRANIAAIVKTHLPGYECSIIGVDDKEYTPGYIDVYVAPTTCSDTNDISMLQEQLSRRAVANPACNLRVLSAIQCHVSVQLTVSGKYKTNIQQQVADYITNQCFVKSIRAYDIHALLGKQNPALNVHRIVLNGTITTADNSINLEASDCELIIPRLYAQRITPNTVATYCTPDDITICDQSE